MFKKFTDGLRTRSFRANTSENSPSVVTRQADSTEKKASNAGAAAAPSPASIIANSPISSSGGDPAKKVNFATTTNHAEEDEDTTTTTPTNTAAAAAGSRPSVQGGGRTLSKKFTEVSYDEHGQAIDNKDVDANVSLALKQKRRGDVFVEHIDTKERLDSLLVVPKTPEQEALILQALTENVLFGDLGDEEITMMINTMRNKDIAQGEIVISQGEQGDAFYVVHDGTFSFQVDGQKVGSLAKSGNSFGELALLFNSPRAATVVCEEKGSVWFLPRNTFRQIVSSAVSRSRTETSKALKSVVLLSELTDQQIDSLVDCVTSVRFDQGDTVIRKGDKGRVLYFIKSGEVECTKIGTSSDADAMLSLGPGEYFGERALMTSEPRAANVIAKTELECICLDKDDFEQQMGPLLSRLDRNLGARVLKTLALFKDLTDAEREKLVEDFEDESFKQGEVVFKQGDLGSKFYIIREGVFDVSKEVGNTGESAHLASLKNGDFFGEGALLKDEPRGADIKCASPVGRVFSLEREAFDASMHKLKQHISRHHSIRMDVTDDTIRAKKKEQYEGVLMSDLEIMRTLGTGTFGRVKLVHSPKLKKAFAMKQLQKAAIVAYRQQTNVISEKTIMEQADHPFILRLHKTFKDQNCLYMLLEFVQGGELFSLLHIRGGKLGDKDARFYAACVQDALEYLHDRDIVYRDLKPENLLIDEEGYIRVVDFGFSKKITTRSFTLCGTPEYLAPELVLGKGHNKAVDIWALGVLIYEMIAGTSPFADHVNGDHMVICKKIVRNKVEYPRRFAEKAKDLVSRLLVREPHLRIGCLSGGHQDIKDHQWMKSMDYGALVRKRIKAPWTPEIKNYLDTTSFEDFEEDDNVEPFVGDSSWADAF